jgi:hypothetical protein
MQGGVRSLRPVGEEEMDRNIATERACPTDFWIVGEEPSPSPRSEREATVWLSRGAALILVFAAVVRALGGDLGGCRLAWL